MRSSDSPRAVLCDLDGVIWLAHQPIAGSVAAVEQLRSAGHRVLFVTNNSAALVEEQEAVLQSIGIPATGDVLTSAQAAAQLVQPGQRALVCGGAGIVQALERRGVEAILNGEREVERGVDVDAVVVGFHRTFDFAGLTRAARAVASGARLIGTNDDATYPTPDGPIPGGGSILAAVETASGVHAEVAGKPHEPMAALVRSRVGAVAASEAVMVGDRPSTDGLFARRLGCLSVHVWSGITTPGSALEPQPDLAFRDLATMAAALVGGGFRR